MCEKAVSKKHFTLKHCLDKYKTQDMCHKVVDACLIALKFVPDWYVTNKILNILDNAVFLNGDIVFVNADSDNVTTFSNGLGLVIVGLNNISKMMIILTMTNLKLLFLLDLWLGIIYISNARHVKKRSAKSQCLLHGTQKDSWIVAWQKMKKRNRAIFD